MENFDVLASATSLILGVIALLLVFGFTSLILPFVVLYDIFTNDELSPIKKVIWAFLTLTTMNVGTLIYGIFVTRGHWVKIFSTINVFLFVVLIGTGIYSIPKQKELLLTRLDSADQSLYYGVKNPELTSEMKNELRRQIHKTKDNVKKADFLDYTLNYNAITTSLEDLLKDKKVTQKEYYSWMTLAKSTSYAEQSTFEKQLTEVKERSKKTNTLDQNQRSKNSSYKNRTKNNAVKKEEKLINPFFKSLCPQKSRVAFNGSLKDAMNRIEISWNAVKLMNNEVDTWSKFEKKFEKEKGPIEFSFVEELLLNYALAIKLGGTVNSVVKPLPLTEGSLRKLIGLTNVFCDDANNKWAKISVQCTRYLTYKANLSVLYEDMNSALKQIPANCPSK